MPTRYGGYHFDDDGAPAASAAVIEAGVLKSPVGAASRAGHVGPARPEIGHLSWSPGAATDAALVAGVDDGWVIEDARVARVDPVSWSVAIDAGRARRIKNGATTGHVHADVELSGTVPAILRAISGTSSNTVTIAIRDGDSAAARWRSLDVPWLVTRAELASRRAP
jgi:TldD protein